VLPNIKQRTNAKKGKNRKKAAKIFNASIYHYIGLIEGIFGAEEASSALLQIQIKEQSEKIWIN
jgi:hypothetical protein